jgi:hypothetical protein
MKMLKLLALTVVCIGLSGCSPAQSPDSIIKQAVTATAQSYFEGGVQSALLVKALHPEYTGTLARDEAYREWLKISTNDPYIKAPALPQMTFDQFTNLLVQSGIMAATNWFLVQGFGVPTNSTGTTVLTIEGVVRELPRQKGILLYHHSF